MATVTSIPDERALRLRLLGGFALLAGDRALATTPRLQALLAYLVLRRAAAQPRQRLAFALWPDSTEAQARTNLRNLLHLLRRTLPEVERCIELEAPAAQWRIDAPCDVDLIAFEDALAHAAACERDGAATAAHAARAAAVAGYGGDLLPGCDDEWLAPERERLRAAYAAVLARLLRDAERAGDQHAATGYAERLAAHDPASEAPYRALMRLHARAGDRAAALRAYRRGTGALGRELGVGPSRAMREEYARLLPREADADVPASGTGRYHRLPAEPGSLIGRAAEVAALRARLGQPEVRLLTLTGPGGTGKTRLALAAAAASLDHFPGGACFVNLVPLRDPAMVAGALAAALGLPQARDEPPAAAVSRALRDQRPLVVLDNCEHLLDACADLAAGLLAACPHLTILATSRAPLRLAWEHEFAVPPLDMPDPARLPPLDALAAVPAVALFCARARAASRAFALTPEHAPTIAAICAHLDGLPLAIELAAARVRTLAPAAIAARLAAPLDLLTGSDRDRPHRHRAQRDVIAWSYDLLDREGQRLFRALGAFVGGGTAEAAMAVAIAGMAAEAALERLAEQSLITLAEGPCGERRFALLETIREYAAERLAAAGEAEEVAGHHAAYFLALAERAEPFLGGTAQPVWLDRLEGELGNLRAALGWLLDRGDRERALRLAGSLWMFWQARHAREGLAWLETALADVAPVVAPATRAKALKTAGELAVFLPDYARGAPYLRAAVALYRDLGDDWHRGDTLGSLGWATLIAGETASAAQILDESARLGRATGHVASLAWALNGLGVLTRERGELDRAGALLTEALAIHRARGDTMGAAAVLVDLGLLGCARGDHTRAAAHLRESLSHFRALGARTLEARALIHLGLVASYRGDHAGAASWYEESLAVYRDLGDRPRTAEVTYHLALALCRAGDTARAGAHFAEALGLLRVLDTEQSHSRASP
jgi:predicted ATPase/DNA-binding SARP family transcriptional activator